MSSCANSSTEWAAVSCPNTEDQNRGWATCKWCECLMYSNAMNAAGRGNESPRSDRRYFAHCHERRLYFQGLLGTFLLPETFCLLRPMFPKMKKQYKTSIFQKKSIERQQGLPELPLFSHRISEWGNCRYVCVCLCVCVCWNFTCKNISGYRIDRWDQTATGSQGLG